MMRLMRFFCTFPAFFFLAFAAPAAALSEEAVQGWTDKERERFYHLPQGSRMMPYDWFLALEDEAGTGLFSSPENLQTYGFIPSPYKGDLNPDGLPVGFAIENVRDGARS